jgi:hypothetical protein
VTVIAPVLVRPCCWSSPVLPSTMSAGASSGASETTSTLTFVPSTARSVVRLRIETGPLRIFVGQLHALDTRQIDDRDAVLAAACAFGIDVVLQRSPHRIEAELEA